MFAFLTSPVPRITALLAVGALFFPALTQAQSDIDLTSYTLSFSDEFTTLSATTSSPKGASTWYAGSPPNGSTGVYGYATRDINSLSVVSGVLQNKVWLYTGTDTIGGYCGGPVGMKNSAGTALVTAGTLGAQINNKPGWQWYGWTGMKFTVGASSVVVSQLGRYAISTNTQTHQVRIFNASSGADVAKALVNCSGKTGFVYANIIGGNVTLAANTSYYLMTDNYSGADYFYSGVGTTVTGTGGITVNESKWGAWHSGALYSVDTTAAGFSQKYGYFEMRAKLPSSGTGSWPSFWMKTLNDISHIGNVEEIDIFEWYGNTFSAVPQQAVIQEASHNWIATGGEDNTAPHLYSPATPMPGGAYPWAGFHIYGFKSTPTHCTWYIDGVQTNQIATPSNYLTNPMWMILEYSLGGGWPLDGIVANSKVEIDWVRVFKESVTNSSFDIDASGAQTITGWSESGTNPSASVTSSSVTPHTGARYLAHSLAGAYDVFTFQTVSGLVNGTYTLSAWVQRSGAQTTAQMEASGFGGTTMTAAIPVSSVWTQISITGLNVTNGTCTIGFRSVAPGGAFIRVDDVSLAASTVPDIIVDNTSAEFTGTWTGSTNAPNYYQAGYVYNATGAGADKVRWRPNLSTAGNYSVYYWIPNGLADRATNAPFTIFYNGGSQTYSVNEQVTPGGTWILLGTKNFLAGTAGYVELTDNANGNYVIADAIKFVKQ